MVAALGIVLQLAVVLFFSFITYYPTSRFEKDDKPVVGYAFPLTAGGTFLLILGMLMCSHVVDSSTDETRYKVVGERRVQLVWLQTESKVSDQVFSPVAIHRRKPCEMVTTSSRVVKDSHDRDTSGQPAGEDTETSARSTAFSRENNAERATLRSRLRRAPQDPITEKPEGSRLATTAAHKDSRGIPIEFKALLGTIICLSGFIVQFVGLRSMHWSASVTQLAAVLTMAILRTWVRRGFTDPLDTQDLTSGHELDWFVLTLADLQGAPWCKGVVHPEAARSPTGSTPMSALSDNIRRALIGDNSRGIKKEAVGSWIVDQIEDSTTTITRSSRVDGPEGPYLETSDRRTAQGLLTLRANLGSLAGWRGPASAEAIRLSAAMETVLNTMFPRLPTIINPVPHAHYNWSIEVGYTKSSGAAPERQMVDFRLTWNALEKTWKVRADEIDAALSLWVYSAIETNKQDGVFRFPPVDDNWLRGKGLRPEKAYRKLGRYTYRLAQDLRLWMPADGLDILRCDGDIREGGKYSNIAGYVQDKHLPQRDSLPRYEQDDEHWKRLNAIQLSDYSNWWDSSDWSCFPYVLDGSVHMDTAPQSTCDSEDVVVAKGTKRSTSNSKNISTTEGGVENPYPWYPRWYPFTDSENPNVYPYSDSENPNDGSEGTPVIDTGNDHHSSDGSRDSEQGGRDQGKMEADIYDEEAEEVLDNEMMEDGPADEEVEAEMDDEGMENGWADDEGMEDEEMDYIPPDGPDDRFLIPAVASQDALAESYAKDLFSAFTWAVAKKGKRVFTSHADIQMAPTPVGSYASWKYFTSQSSQLSKFAQDIHSTGLQSLHEVYLSIIPPFSFHGRLPRLGGVFERACEEGKREERLMRWEAADDTYAHLLMLAIKYPPGSWNYRYALAIAIQYLEARTARFPFIQFYDPEEFYTEVDVMVGQQQSDERRLRSVLVTQKGTVRLLKLRDLRRPRAILHETDIHCQAGRGDQDAVDILLATGTSPGVADIRDLTPLHYACQHGHEGVAEVLLRHGARADAQNLDGCSPLHLAALNGHDKVAAKLVRNRAPTGLRDNYGRLPIHCAAMNGHRELVGRFIADAGVPDGKGRTALHYAAWFGQVDVLKSLLDSMGSSGLGLADSAGLTPLHLAAKKGQDEAVRCLIDAGDDVHATCNLDSSTPLHVAARWGRRNVITLIVAKDQSTLDARTEEMDYTPLMVAKHFHHHPKVCDLLTTKKTRRPIKKAWRRPGARASRRGRRRDA